MARILIADDESQVRTVMSLACHLDGHTVVEAKDTDSTVQAYLQHKPDALLLDLMMPGGGGVVALERIRELTDREVCPVVIVSGHLEMLADGTAELGRPVLLLQKPFDLASLRGAVRLALQNADAAQAPAAR